MQENKRLLVSCVDGHVLEVSPPDPEAVDQSKTYKLNGEVNILYFKFQSVKSKLRVRDECSEISLSLIN